MNTSIDEKRTVLNQSANNMIQDRKVDLTDIDDSL